MDNFYASYPVENGGGSGVTSLNGLTGALTLVAGSGISITPAGSNITIATTGGPFANTFLSNLDSPTSINQNLLPSTILKTLGQPNGSQWASVYASNYRAPSDGADVVLVAQNLASGNTGGVHALSGNAISGNSGNITLTIGSASGTRGNIIFQDGTEGVSGYVWTSIDTNGSGSWMPSSGGGGANTSLSNLSAVAINTGLIFGASVAGSLTTADDASLSQDLTLSTGNTTAASGLSGNIILIPGTGPTSSSNSGSISLATQSIAGAGAIAGDILLTAGSAATHSGNIVLRLTNALGAFGKLKIKDGSEGTVGSVWTSVDTAGSGSWVAANQIGAFRIVTNNDSVSAAVDYKIVCNAGAGSFTLNLPPGSNGLNYILVQAASNSGVFTIVPDGADVLDTNIQAIFNSNQPVPITFISGTWYAV